MEDVSAAGITGLVPVESVKVDAQSHISHKFKAFVVGILTI